MTKKFFSVILPVHNLAENLPILLVNLDYCLSRQKTSSEVIIVDCGSTDGSKEIAKKLSSILKSFNFFASDEAGGLDRAVILGLKVARGEWRLVVNAGNFTAGGLIKILPHLKRGLAVISNSRRRVNFNRFWQNFIRLAPENWRRFLFSLSRWPAAQSDWICFSEKAVSSLLPALEADYREFFVKALTTARQLDLKVKIVSDF